MATQRRKTKDALKLIGAQEESQQRLNEASALLNFSYGEQAADEAHKRSIDLYDYKANYENYENTIARAKEAGVNPLAVLGMGGGGAGGIGGGAMGDGAGGQRAQAPNYLDVLSVKSQAKVANAEALKAGKEAALLTSQKRNIDADTNLKLGQENKIGAEIENILQDTNNKITDQIGSEINNELNRINVEIADAGKEFNKDRAELDYEKAYAEYYKLYQEGAQAKTKADFDKEAYQTNLKQLGAELILTGAKIKAEEKGIELTEQEIKYLEKAAREIETDTIIKQWEAGNFKANRIYNTGERLLNTVIGGATIGRGLKAK